MFAVRHLTFAISHPLSATDRGYVPGYNTNVIMDGTTYSLNVPVKRDAL